MAQIRHIAIQTQDEEATANFYVENFGLKKVRKLESDRTSGRRPVHPPPVPEGLGSGRAVTGPVPVVILSLWWLCAAGGFFCACRA